MRVVRGSGLGRWGFEVGGLGLKFGVWGLLHGVWGQGLEFVVQGGRNFFEGGTARRPRVRVTSLDGGRACISCHLVN